jgi:hypothetical protein
MKSLFGFLGVGSFFLIFAGVGGIEHANDIFEVLIWLAVSLIGALATWVFAVASTQGDE